MSSSLQCVLGLINSFFAPWYCRSNQQLIRQYSTVTNFIANPLILIHHISNSMKLKSLSIYLLIKNSIFLLIWWRDWWCRGCSPFQHLRYKKWTTITAPLSSMVGTDPVAQAKACLIWWLSTKIRSADGLKVCIAGDLDHFHVWRLEGYSRNYRLKSLQLQLLRLKSLIRLLRLQSLQPASTTQEPAAFTTTQSYNHNYYDSEAYNYNFYYDSEPTALHTTTPGPVQLLDSEPYHSHCDSEPTTTSARAPGNSFHAVDKV